MVRAGEEGPVVEVAVSVSPDLGQAHAQSGGVGVVRGCGPVCERERAEDGLVGDPEQPAGRAVEGPRPEQEADLRAGCRGGRERSAEGVGPGGGRHDEVALAVPGDEVDERVRPGRGADVLEHPGECGVAAEEVLDSAPAGRGLEMEAGIGWEEPRVCHGRVVPRAEPQAMSAGAVLTWMSVPWVGVYSCHKPMSDADAQLVMSALSPSPPGAWSAPREESS